MPFAVEVEHAYGEAERPEAGKGYPEDADGVEAGDGAGGGGDAEFGAYVGFFFGSGEDGEGREDIEAEGSGPGGGDEHDELYPLVERVWCR